MISAKTRSPISLGIITLALIGFSMHSLGLEQTLDRMQFYTADEASLLLNSLSESGVRDYLKNEILDLFFLATYSTLFFNLIRRYFEKINWLHWCALVPGIFDVVETSTIIRLLTGNLLQPPTWLGYVTCLKWIGVTIMVLLISVAFIRRPKEV